MNELFYGDGICSVKGSNIVGVWKRCDIDKFWS